MGRGREWGGESMGSHASMRPTSLPVRQRASSLGPERCTPEADPVPLGGAFELLVSNLVRQARNLEHVKRAERREVLGLYGSSRAVFGR